MRSLSPPGGSMQSPSCFCSPGAPGRHPRWSGRSGHTSPSTEVGTLSIGAMRRMLSERLGLSLPRHVLRRVYETTLGNPLFSLEVGRTISGSGTPALTEDVPLPHAVEDLLGTRVAQLDPPVRRLMLALALDPDLRVSRLAAIADEGVLEDALDAGVVTLDGDRLRPAHPLLAAAAKSGSRARDRRALHLKLADVSSDDELRALHLALAAQLPEEGLADTVAAAATGASARGSAQQAVVLAEHALRLTPAGLRRSRSERVLDLAGYLEVAGERQRVTDLLEPELDSFSPSRPRPRLAASVRGRRHQQRLRLDRVPRPRPPRGEDEPELRASCWRRRRTSSPPTPRRSARRRHGRSKRCRPRARPGPSSSGSALHGLGWARAMRGLPIDDVCERFRACSDAAAHITDSPEPVEGLRLLWRGEIEPARTMLTNLLT